MEEGGLNLETPKLSPNLTFYDLGKRFLK